MDELYWLLLPFAAVVGWLAASHRGGKSGRRTGSLLDPDYFKGLNYLLNEQPD